MDKKEPIFDINFSETIVRPMEVDNSKVRPLMPDDSNVLPMMEDLTHIRPMEVDNERIIPMDYNEPQWNNDIIDKNKSEQVNARKDPFF